MNGKRSIYLPQCISIALDGSDAYAELVGIDLSQSRNIVGYFTLMGIGLYFIVDIFKNLFSFIKTPETFNNFEILLSMIIPIQLLAYYISTMREIDVDKPRNLAKSVTVE